MSDTYDPITFSVMLGRFDSIVNEMTLTLEHTAWTSILAICRDFSCAVYDASPRQISMYDALPIHTTSLHLVLREIARTFDGQVRDGDVYLCNDPYRFNTHVGDLVTACPVFVDGEHRFWAVTKGHQMDVGAFVPSSVTASAQNIWQEGIQIPPLKLVDAGAMRHDVLDLYLANMRYRDLLHGDLLAQLASIEKGRRRLIELTRGVRRRGGAVLRRADPGVRRPADVGRGRGDAGRRVHRRGLGRQRRHRPDRPADQGARDDRGRPHRGRLHRQRAAGPRWRERLAGDVAGDRGDPLPLLRRPDDPAQRRLHPAHRRDRTRGDDLQRPLSRLDVVRDRDSVRLHARRDQQGDDRCGARPGAGGRHEAVEPAAVLGPRPRDGRGLGRDAVQRHRRQRCGARRRRLAALRVDRRAWRGQDAADRAGRAALPAARRANGDRARLDGLRHLDRRPRHAARGAVVRRGDGVRDLRRRRGEPAARRHRRHRGPRRRCLRRGPVRRAAVRLRGRPRPRRRARLWVGVSTGGGGYGDPTQRPAELVRERRARRHRLAARRPSACSASCSVPTAAADAAATTARRDRLREVRRPAFEPSTPGASTWVERNRRDGDVYLLNPL